MISLVRRACILLLGLACLGTVSASPSAPENGVEYLVLSRPQPAEGGKKIEIVEFFGYFCPHCYALEPLLADWLKKKGESVVFRRIHVGFHGLVTQQKLFYTLEAMGKLDEYNIKAFNAYHIDRNRLSSDAEVMEFVGKSGLDKSKFNEIYNSFAIQSRLNRATQMMEAYGITAVPTLAVDGKFLTMPTMAATRLNVAITEDVQNRAVLQVLDKLIEKVQKERAASESSGKAGKHK